MTLPADTGRCERVAIAIQGAVQGVGFRPFVYRLARELELSGWVSNSPEGVLIEAEGDRNRLLAFLLRLQEDKPLHASIRDLRSHSLEPEGSRGFTILPSSSEGAATAEVLPDLAVCPECMAEVLDPMNRRYRYPFANCTHCGPRFTIVESLPYDRRNTTMKLFPMCPMCRAEYDDPADRRFHAQPTACPECGPHLALWTPHGATAARRDDALRLAADAVRRGEIVAVKGLGGFHLLADARSDSAILRLRSRKRRDAKPFAVLFPGVDALRSECDLSPAEEDLLRSGAAPIVLLRRRSPASSSPDRVSAMAAPGNPLLGGILPYTPLHHLLMRELAFPVIATSGNLSEEPICIDEHEALGRLAGIADLFLVHDRPIRRHCDDSVARIVEGEVMILRRARGYAPHPVRIDQHSRRPLLAVGAHQKNSVALLAGTNAVLSQHIGDLSTLKAYEAFEQEIASLQELYPGAVGEIACDQHPGYLSSIYARDHTSKVRTVQHHYAHVASCMAEHGLEGSVLGVAWDGTGYGPDGTVWGGEFLLTGAGTYRRVASFRPFPLPGGEKAVREPRRSAIGLLNEVLGSRLFSRGDLAPLRSFTEEERLLLRQAVARGIGSPRTSSVGRLFDAVASILGLLQKSEFEGQAAMALEFLSHESDARTSYPFEMSVRPGTALLEIDWAPMVEAVLSEIGNSAANARVAAKFHNTLAEIIVAVARRFGEARVVLTGGCFQNASLLERSIRLLRSGGFEPIWHRRIPPNDGGIALGQLYACIMEDEFQKEGAHDVSRHTG